MNRKTLLIVLTVAVAIVASACSGPSPKIAITTAPPASLEINNSVGIAATTVHDKGEGVDWSCSPSPCGTFSPAHTASGATTVYTAPSTPGAVTITAASTKKASVTATASVTINPVATASSLSGQYAFKLAGWDAAGDFYAAAGSVTLDGNGNVTTGEEDLNNTSFGAPVLGDALTGTYTVGPDGQGTMTLNATTGGNPDTNVGVGGTQTLAFTVVNANHAQIIEFDSAATSGGSLDFQSGAAITAGYVGNYAFTFFGWDEGDAYAVGGVLTSTGTSITGPVDVNIDGTVDSGNTVGSVTAPDANGRGTFTLGGTTYTYYIVGAEAVYFVETDVDVVTAGSAFGQGAAPNFTAASLTGAYVMDVPWPTGEGADGVFGFAGQFTADGVSAITGVVDYDQEGVTDTGNPDTLTADYETQTNGYGQINTGVVSSDTDFTTWGAYFVDPAINVIDPNNASGGGGALLVELDANAIGAGFVLPQTATAENVVNNGEDFASVDSTDDLINVDGQVALSPTSSVGTASVNDINPSTPSQTESSAQTISSVITADAVNAGRYTLVLTPENAASPLNLVVYVVGGGLSITVEVDPDELGSGTTQGQQ